MDYLPSCCCIVPWYHWCLFMTHCSRSLTRTLLLKLKSTSIRHMILRFDVRTPFTLFSRITLKKVSNPLVNILLCRIYGKGILQDMKWRTTVDILWGVQNVDLIYRLRRVLSSLMRCDSRSWPQGRQNEQVKKSRDYSETSHLYQRKIWFGWI